MKITGKIIYPIVLILITHLNSAKGKSFIQSNKEIGSNFIIDQSLHTSENLENSQHPLLTPLEKLTRALNAPELINGPREGKQGSLSPCSFSALKESSELHEPLISHDWCRLNPGDHLQQSTPELPPALADDFVDRTITANESKHRLKRSVSSGKIFRHKRIQSKPLNHSTNDDVKYPISQSTGRFENLFSKKVRQARSVSSQDANQNKTQAQSVLDLLKKGEETVTFEDHDDAVLVMGNTGSGKSTLTQFITGQDENLISYEDQADSGDFLIRDVSNKIGSTITSWTIFPEKVVDSKTNTIFYDCPGFSDTRGIANDIAGTYYTKEVLKHSKRIKILFTVNYPSVRIGVDRQDFMTFAEHVATVIKNIDKFNESIALIITKVDNQYRKGVLVSDDKVIQSVAGFLRKVRSEIQRKITDGFSEEKGSFGTIVKFIDAILKQDGQNNYPKIGIFRRPDAPGPLRTVNSLRESKEPIERIIFQNTDYVQHEEDDFGYTISAESKVCIHNLVEVIKENIVYDISILNRQIENHFSAIEERSNDIEGLYALFHQAHEVLLFGDEMPGKPRQFAEKMAKSLSALSVSSRNLREPLSRISRQDRYLEFFQTFGARRIDPLEWGQEVNGLEKHLSASENYYNFLLQLLSALCSYEMQNNKKKFTAFSNKYSNQSEFLRNDSKIVIEDFLMMLPIKEQQISRLHYEKIENEKLSVAKLKKLISLFNMFAELEVTISCDEENRSMRVKGYIVKLSDVFTILAHSCLDKNVKFLEVFALEKIFIDSDLDLTGTGAQVSMIAPILEVTSRHKIVMNGLEGQRHDIKKAGNWRSQYYSGDRWHEKVNGHHGAPGLPGHPAGKFLAIGKNIIGGQLLSVFAVGGRGGPGQDGGDGSDGTDGTSPDPEYPYSYATAQYHCDPTNPTFLSKIGLEDVCTVVGKGCSDGGDAGVGGAGGRGGKPGQVLLIGLDRGDLVSRFVSDGKEGVGGHAGNYGRAGWPGKVIKFEDFTLLMYRSKKIVDTWHLKLCSDGDHGWGRKNSIGPWRPQGDSELLYPARIINKYKTFARKHLTTSARPKYLRNFVTESLTNDESVMSFYETLDFVDDLRSLENDSQKSEEKTYLPFFYESLLQRIGQYMQKREKNYQPLEDKLLISYLYAAAVSKVNNVFKLGNDLTDLQEIFNRSREDLGNLGKFGETHLSSQLLALQKETLSQEVTEMRQFIEEQLNADIYVDSIESAGEMKTMVDEVVGGQNSNEKKPIISEKQQQNLEDRIIMKNAVNTIKIISALLNYSVSLGEAILSPSMGETANSEVNAIHNNEISANEIQEKSLLSVFNAGREYIRVELNNSKLRNAQKLKYLHKVLEEFKTKALPANLETAIDMKLIHVIGRFQDSMVSLDILDSESLDLLDEVNSNISILCNEVRKANGTKKENQNIIDPCNSIYLSILDLDHHELYNEIENDTFSKIEFLGNSLEQLRKKFSHIIQFEHRIFKVISKFYTNLDLTTKEGVSEKSVVNLFFEGWQVQETLRDIKEIVMAVRQEIKSPMKLKNHLSMIDEILTTLTDVHDRIKNFHENTKLVSYVSDITKNFTLNTDVQNPVIKENIDELKFIIQSNLASQVYKTTFNVFLQCVFPFYNVSSSLPQMPSPKKLDATSSIISSALKDLEIIREFTSTNYTNTQSEIRKSINFSGENDDAPPFYSWKHRYDKTIVPRLFDGKEVTVKADVTRGLPENAIKFNVIEVYFRARNRSVQEEINEKLRLFNITMTHFGAGRYKCEDQYYLITAPRLTISYSFSKTENGDPEYQDHMYAKLKKDDLPIYSPYAFWSFRLTNNDFNYTVLANLKSEIIDVELHGRGQYVSRGASICNDELRQFYKLDRTLSETSDFGSFNV